MSNEPKLKLRDGLICATVWENSFESEDGTRKRISIDINRSYKDGEEWKETSSFSPTELLKVARLAERAYEQILSTRQAEKEGAQ